MGQHEDMTLQDMYNKEGDFDDEDDSDWDPLEQQITIVKWNCVNCTMVNLDDAIYCHVWLFQFLRGFLFLFNSIVLLCVYRFLSILSKIYFLLLCQQVGFFILFFKYI